MQGSFFNNMKTVNIRGVNIADMTMDEAVSFICKRLTSGMTTTVFTTNAEMAYAQLRDQSLRDILNGCDLNVADGIGIIKASRILGCPLREKVAGVELGLKIAEILAFRDIPLFLYGADEGVAELAGNKLAKAFPSLKIAGSFWGYGSEDEAISAINRSGAKAVFVCLGFPKQEKWICENKDKLPGVKLFIGLGGSLDVYSGKKKRAPKIFIDLGMEWLYRLIREPKRIFRMTALPRFYFGTWMCRLRK